MREWLRDLRKAKGLSQADVAKQLDVTYQAVSGWEASSSSPSRANALALAELLGREVLTQLLAEEQAARKAS